MNRRIQPQGRRSPQGGEIPAPSRFSDEALEKMNQTLISLHTAVLGSEGQGGMFNYLKDIHGMVKIQNGRTSRLERWRSFLTGAWVVVSALLVFVLKKVFK